MRPPPSLSLANQYPITSLLGLLAVATTVYWWAGNEIEPLMMNCKFEEGEPWRLFTSTLPHINIIHLIFNLYWIWVFGTLIEKIFGWWRTALLILVLAAGSSASEFAFMSGGVGLSGVGFGFFGFLAVLSKQDHRFSESVDRKTSQLFVAWFFICILLTETKVMAVGNVAHGAGGVLGGLIGYAVSSHGKKRMKFGAAVFGATVLAIGLAGFGRDYVNRSSEMAADLTWCGHVALNENDFHRAAGYLERSTRRDPKNAQTWYLLSIACAKALDNKRALEAYQKAYELDPDDTYIKEAKPYFDQFK